MSASFEAPALNPVQRHLKAFLLRFRRFINRSVAAMLESRERQASRFTLKRFGERELKDIGLRFSSSAGAASVVPHQLGRRA